MWELLYNSELLFLGQEPKPSWPMGRLGDTGQINVLATRNISIPRNPESDAFFEYTGLVTSTSDVPRESAIIKLLYNREPIIDNAIIAGFDVKKQSYNIIIAGDNQALIQVLNRNLSELDLTSYDHVWNSANMAAGLLLDPQVEPYVYARTAYDVSGNYSDTDLLPALSLRAIISAISTDSGISIIDNSTLQFQTLEDWKRSYFQCCSRKFSIKAPESVQYTGPSTEQVAAGTYIMPITLDSFNGTFIQADSINNGIILKNKSDVQFTIDIELTTSGATIPVINLLKTGTGADQRYSLIPDANSLVVPASDININDLFQVEIILEAGDVPATYELQQFDAVATADYVGDGSIFSFNNNLPEIKQIDFIKFVAKKYALFVDYDPVSEVLYFTNYDKYAENYETGEFIDLSSKLVDPDGISIDFKGDLAQENEYQFDNKEPTQKLDGEGVLLVPNTNLDKSKVNYKAPIGIAANYRATTVMPYVEDNSGTLEFKELQPYYTQIFDSNVNPLTGTFTGSGVNENYCTNGYPYITFANFATSFQYAIDNFWVGYNNVVSSFLMATADVKLGYNDIKEITDKATNRPVLLNTKKVNGLFKVSSVDKFRPDGFTSIKMTRLTTEQVAPLPIYYGNSENYTPDSGGKVLVLPNIWPRGTMGNFTQLTEANRPSISPSGGVLFDGNDYLVGPLQNYALPSLSVTLWQVFPDHANMPSDVRFVASLSGTSGSTSKGWQLRITKDSLMRIELTWANLSAVNQSVLIFISLEDWDSTVANTPIFIAGVISPASQQLIFGAYTASPAISTDGIKASALPLALGGRSIGTNLVPSGTKLEAIRLFEGHALTTEQLDTIKQTDLANFPYLGNP